MTTYSGTPVSSAVPADYCTSDDIKAVMVDGSWGTAYDATLALLATRASREFDRLTKKPVGYFYANADVTLYYDGSGTVMQWIDDLAAVPTKVEVSETGDPTKYTTWLATDYMCWPYNALSDGRPYQGLYIDLLYSTKTLWYRFPKSVKITGKFGYSTTVPDEVKQATIIMAVRAFKRGQQAYQDGSVVPELGRIVYVKGMDPEVDRIIGSFREVTI
jgi:hypothetical protein